MSSKGQITISQKVRDAIGLSPGDELEFEVRGNEFIGRRKQSENPFTSLWGLLADGRRTDDVMKGLRPQRAWEDE